MTSAYCDQRFQPCKSIPNAFPESILSPTDSIQLAIAKLPQVRSIHRGAWECSGYDTTFVGNHEYGAIVSFGT